MIDRDNEYLIELKVSVTKIIFVNILFLLELLSKFFFFFSYLIINSDR